MLFGSTDSVVFCKSIFRCSTIHCNPISVIISNSFFLSKFQLLIFYFEVFYSRFWCTRRTNGWFQDNKVMDLYKNTYMDFNQMHHLLPLTVVSQIWNYIVNQLVFVQIAYPSHQMLTWNCLKKKLKNMDQSSTGTFIASTTDQPERKLKWTKLTKSHQNHFTSYCRQINYRHTLLTAQTHKLPFNSQVPN